MDGLFQRSIPEVLRRTANRTPEKIAFTCNDASLTYEALVEKSSQLAAVLKELGVCHGDRVGVFLNQSLESAVAIYGIMTAGALFVPIDPTSPESRVTYVIDRCDIDVVVTAPRMRGRIAGFSRMSERPIRLVGLEDVTDLPVEATISWSDVYAATPSRGARLTAQDLGYIMWTSGSTGAPKGMTHKHGSGLIYAGMLAETHGLNDQDRFLGLSPLHFDMCVMDYIAAPLVGGSTIIVPESTAKLPAALTKLAATERATIWYSVPFAMTQMLEFGAMDKHDLSSLRWMIYGGENFPLEHLRGLMERLPQAKFANAYGPAETHQISSYTVGALGPDAGPIPIGEPWRTLEALILDDDDDVLPPGNVGELVVRSPSCMQGYWGEPTLTDAAMHRREGAGGLSNSYYRTGDLVRQDPDGMMHFLGRKDRQVKVRGYRVELDEVEAAVLSYPTVAECAVIPAQDRRSLVAAVRLHDGADAATDDIVAHCRTRVPIYAVPAKVHLVDAFPRTGSDKIDRSALGALLDCAPGDNSAALATTEGSST
ncbi:MAG: amino acid adenylation domain-containing protein [Pseudomonadota bacterium]